MAGPGKHLECQVCSDVAVGFHCGAHVCEACKKFFIRCLKLKCGERFKCELGNSCSIGKSNRTKCPSCRYQRCLQLNMYGPGSQNVSKEIGHMPCRVCGAPSSGFHFGAITCEGCKGFFRRCLWDRNLGSCRCIGEGGKEGRCQVTWKTRNTCKSCRYKKCLTVGMKANKSRIGRQSNFVKHSIHMALNEIKLAKGLPVDNIFPLFGTSSSSSSPSFSSASSIIPTQEANGIENEKLRARASASTSSTDHSIDCSNVSEDVVDLDSDDVTQAYFPSPLTSSSSISSASATSTSTSSSSSSSMSSFSSPILIRSNLERFPSVRFQDGDSKRMASSRAGLHSRDLSPPSFPALLDFSSGMSKLPSLEPIPYRSEALLKNPSCTQESLVDLMSHLFTYLDPVASKYEIADLDQTTSLKLVWDFEMAHRLRCFGLFADFARRVPGFNNLTLEQQILSTNKCLYPVANLLFAINSNNNNGQGNHQSWFGFAKKDHQKVLKMFDPFKHLLSNFHDLTNYVDKISLDRVEVSFLCALYIVEVGNLYEYKELLLDCLETYIKMKCGSKSERHICVFRCLKELNQAADVQQYVFKLFLADPKINSWAYSCSRRTTFQTTKHLFQESPRPWTTSDQAKEFSVKNSWR